MIRILSILLLFMFLFQNFSKVFIIANYEINKEYIAENLCENRSKPTMHCNGQCHLKKQLQEDEKKQESPANPVKEKNEVQICSGKNAIFFLSPSPILVEKASFRNSYISSKHLLSVFHPPTA